MTFRMFAIFEHLSINLNIQHSVAENYVPFTMGKHCSVSGA